jgi:hypothetical protein
LLSPETVELRPVTVVPKVDSVEAWPLTVVLRPFTVLLKLLTVAVKPETVPVEFTVLLKLFTRAVRLLIELVLLVLELVNPLSVSASPLTSLMEIGNDTDPDATVPVTPPLPPEPDPPPAPDPVIPDPAVVEVRTAASVRAVVLGGTCQVSVHVFVPSWLLYTAWYDAPPTAVVVGTSRTERAPL